MTTAKLSRALGPWMLAAALLFAAAGARASTTTSIDYSDLWWTSTESGWGAGVTLQNDVAFLTLFVYGADRNPVFFVAPEMRATDNGGNRYQGPLYRVRGPFYGGAFNPSAVVPTTVGTATLTFDTATTGTLVYSVDGVQVTKAISRQSWATASLAGTYRGGLTATSPSCAVGTGSSEVTYFGRATVAHEGDQVTIDLNFDPAFASSGLCRYRGTFSQQAHIAKITGGTYTCTFVNGPTPVSGTFEIQAIQFAESGFAGVYSGREGATCTQTGRFGGIRSGY